MSQFVADRVHQSVSVEDELRIEDNAELEGGGRRRRGKCIENNGELKQL